MFHQTCIKPFKVQGGCADSTLRSLHHPDSTPSIPYLYLDFWGWRRKQEPIPADIGREVGNTLDWSPANPRGQHTESNNHSQLRSIKSLQLTWPQTACLGTVGESQRTWREPEQTPHKVQTGNLFALRLFLYQYIRISNYFNLYGCTTSIWSFRKRSMYRYLVFTYVLQYQTDEL